MASPEDRKKWGFPDGRDRSSYPDNIDRWSDDRWRWEFTRRREDYCEDFERAVAAKIKILSAIEPLDKKYDPEDFNPDNPNQVVGGDGDEYVRKYGLKFLLHPNFDFEKFPVYFCDSLGPAGLWIGSGKKCAPVIQTVRLPEGFAAAVVDLSKKIEPQIKQMTVGLYTLQKEQFGDIPDRRKRRDIWIRYLRVIDARAAGATTKELADIAASSEDGNNSDQNTWQVLQAADHLMFNWPA